MIYILFIWVTAGCTTDGICSTMPVYRDKYATEKACNLARLSDDNLDRGAFCISIPKEAVK